MNSIKRWGALASTSVALVIGLSPTSAMAQKPIRMIVPLSPGSTVDVVARVMGNQLSKNLGHTIVIENYAGAGGVPGTGQIARAPKDGSVLGMVSSNHVINPSIYKSIPFDAMKDITPITILGTVPMVLVVNPSLPVKDVQGLIALAKAKPATLNYGSAGNGSVPHLAAELFSSEAGGLDVRHVPYKGSGPMTTDLLGNQVQFGFLSVTVAAPHIKTGKLRALGVSTPARSAHLPGVPTLAEQGLPHYSFDAWIALVAPAGLPPAMMSNYYEKSKAALASKEVQDGLATQGIVIIGNTPDKAAAFFQSELVKHAKLVKQSGASLE
ncbi:Bug family tripartite tricarboxylate transporter substrate binding protein [Massilia niastensis]|uniref:Bug family tripartite tricarboxylate transporter substrate binding protein n=1 Tax=Massilia niastensis TaxID=544911 RepID=UPI00047786DD|nr:tripartite tricarboxylate transporter substrate binding protein [Massilia niastensis]